MNVKKLGKAGLHSCNLLCDVTCFCPDFFSGAGDSENVIPMEENQLVSVVELLLRCALAVSQ